MIPQNIIDDLAAIQAKVAEIQSDQAAIPDLQTAATAANASLLAAQNELVTDTADVAASIVKLQADIAALNGGSPIPPPPPPEVTTPSAAPRGSPRHVDHR